ncbi:MAG: hypothetical protein LBF97_01330 [Elusimicrobiota bacterium]|jgi:hypothetical protein|nr:hypothetical protein [Elusimicrobiota bacterium]
MNTQELNDKIDKILSIIQIKQINFISFALNFILNKTCSPGTKKQYTDY